MKTRLLGVRDTAPTIPASPVEFAQELAGLLDTTEVDSDVPAVFVETEAGTYRLRIRDADRFSRGQAARKAGHAEAAAVVDRLVQLVRCAREDADSEGDEVWTLAEGYAPVPGASGLLVTLGLRSVPAEPDSGACDYVDATRTRSFAVLVTAV